MINLLNLKLFHAIAQINPPTGEKPLSGWIIALIILAGAAILLCALYPLFSKFYKNRKK